MAIRKIRNRLERIGSKTGIISLFLLSHTVLMLMMLFTFPQINAKFGTQAFDLKPLGYSQSEATQMLQNLDQPTIDLYLFPQLFLLDIFYPLLLALFLSTFIIRLSNLIKLNKDHVFSNLFMLPFIAMLFDYLENIMIALMITNPTSVLSVVMQVANIFTLMKGVFTSLSWLVILCLLFVWLFNLLKSKKHSPQTFGDKR